MTLVYHLHHSTTVHVFNLVRYACIICEHMPYVHLLCVKIKLCRNIKPFFNLNHYTLHYSQ